MKLPRVRPLPSWCLIPHLYDWNTYTVPCTDTLLGAGKVLVVSSHCTVRGNTDPSTHLRQLIRLETLAPGDACYHQGAEPPGRPLWPPLTYPSNPASSFRKRVPGPDCVGHSAQVKTLKGHPISFTSVQSEWVSSRKKQQK